MRRAYAKQVMVPYNAAHPRVEAAFAAVRRKAFLRPGRSDLPEDQCWLKGPDWCLAYD